MVSQFEVYWVDLNPTMGAEMQKIRPCVIVSPKELNDHLDTVIIVPVTSAIHGYPYRIACNIMGPTERLSPTKFVPLISAV